MLLWGTSGHHMGYWRLNLIQPCSRIIFDGPEVYIVHDLCNCLACIQSVLIAGTTWPPEIVGCSPGGPQVPPDVVMETPGLHQSSFGQLHHYWAWATLSGGSLESLSRDSPAVDITNEEGALAKFHVFFSGYKKPHEMPKKNFFKKVY